MQRLLIPSARLAHPTRLVEPSATFLNPLEVQYFDTYRHNVIFQFGYGEDEFWSRTVLRESTRDDCIRNAIVGLGALARAQEEYDLTSSLGEPRAISKPKKPLCKTGLLSSSTHYYQALSHYTRAVASMRRLITIYSQDIEPGTSRQGGGSSSGGTARAILIATLLLVTFESIQGNTAAADQLSARTLSLLQYSIMTGTLGEGQDTGRPASRIAGSVDDEGTHDTEVVLVRNTFFTAGLMPSYPMAREVIGRISSGSARGPMPPAAAESACVFSRLWTRCQILSSLWFVRNHEVIMKAHSQATHSPQSSDSSSSPESGGGIPDTFEVPRQEQVAITKILHAWKMATEERLCAARAQVAMLTATEPTGDTPPQYHADLVAARRQVNTFIGISALILSCLLSIGCAFDTTGEAWASYEHWTLEMVKRREDMFSEDDKAAAVSAGGRSGSGLRHYFSDFAGMRPVLGHMTQHQHDPSLRRHMMALWRSRLHGSTHWDIQGDYLCARAVFDVEESHRAVLDEKLPPEKQYRWVSGEWNDDYSEFKVAMVARAPGDNGVTEVRVVAMPALE